MNSTIQGFDLSETSQRCRYIPDKNMRQSGRSPALRQPNNGPISRNEDYDLSDYSEVAQQRDGNGGNGGNGDTILEDLKDYASDAYERIKNKVTEVYQDWSKNNDSTVRSRIASSGIGMTPTVVNDNSIPSSTTTTKPAMSWWSWLLIILVVVIVIYVIYRLIAGGKSTNATTTTTYKSYE